MTREEAIEQLKWYFEYDNGLSADKETVEAYRMSIKALEQEPSGDLISRQAVNILVDELARAISDERCCISRGRSTATIMQDILDIPSVNPQEPKTGHWIEGSDTDIMGEKVYWYTCSNCNEDRGQKTNYCPNCGAKMERSDKG